MKCHQMCEIVKSLSRFVQVLGSNLETLAAVLDVEVNMVLELVIRQPTLLAAQVWKYWMVGN